VGKFVTFHSKVEKIMSKRKGSLVREELIDEWFGDLTRTNEIAKHVVKEFDDTLGQLKHSILHEEYPIDEQKFFNDTIMIFKALKNNTDSRIPQEDTIFVNMWAMRLLEEHDVTASEVDDIVRERYLEYGCFKTIDFGVMKCEAQWTKDFEGRDVLTLK